MLASRFASSDISSVIALEKPETGSKRTKRRITAFLAKLLNAKGLATAGRIP
jgi:hypothetical protein